MKKQIFLAVIGFCSLISAFGLLIVGEVFERSEVYYQLFHLFFAVGLVGSLGYLFSTIETTQPKK